MRPIAKTLVTAGLVVGVGVVSMASEAEPIEIETMRWPAGLAMDVEGRLYFADRRAHHVYRVDLRAREAEIIAGTGEMGFSGDGAPATSAQFYAPNKLVIESGGDVVVTDRVNCRVRRIDAQTGLVTTVAGTGERGYEGDGGLATKALLSSPYGIELCPDRSFLITDTDNHCIRRIDAATGVITTVAGTGEGGFEGDGGPATEALLARPHDVLLAPNGDIVIADSFSHRIRRVDHETGIITTIAGKAGEKGDPEIGMLATEVTLHYFGALDWDRSGDLIFGSYGDNRFYQIDSSTGQLLHLAGAGHDQGIEGEGVPAAEIRVFAPRGLLVDDAGNIFFSEARGNRIRMIDGESGLVHTVVRGPFPEPD